MDRAACTINRVKTTFDSLLRTEGLDHEHENADRSARGIDTAETASLPPVYVLQDWRLSANRPCEGVHSTIEWSPQSAEMTVK